MKKVLRRLCLTIFTTVLWLALIGMAWSYALSTTIRDQSTVKRWLEGSGFYDNVSGMVLEQVAQETQQPGLAAVADNNEVQQIANNALGTGFIQDVTERTIGAIYSWLEGEISLPEFSINIGDAAQRLAAGMGDFAEQRAAALPICNDVQLREMDNQLDALNMPCRPANVSPQQAGATVESQLQTAFEELPVTNLNTQDIWTNREGDEPWFIRARDVYQRSRWLPHIFTALTLVVTLGVVFVSSTRRRGISRAAMVYITGGIVIGLSAFVLGRGPGWLSERINQSEGNQTSLELVGRLIEVAGHDISGRLWWFAGAFVLVGIIGLVLAKLLGRRKQNKKPPVSTDPTPPIDDSPKQSAPTAQAGRSAAAQPPATQPPKKRPPRKIQL